MIASKLQVTDSGPTSGVVGVAAAGLPATIGSSGFIVVWVLNSQPSTTSARGWPAASRKSSAPLWAFHSWLTPSSEARSPSSRGSSGVVSATTLPAASTVTGLVAWRTSAQVNDGP